MAEKTDQQYEHVIKICREVFEQKMKDYGTAWRILRPSSLTDQLFIKASRIRSIETKGKARIKDDIRSEFIGIINYAIMGLIQLELAPCDHPSMDADEAVQLYDRHIYAAKNLMLDKNHDYDEAWRNMRISSYTDLILMKIHRTKQIENNQGKTVVSEGIDANYMDMINYAVFGLIKIEFPESSPEPESDSQN